MNKKRKYAIVLSGVSNSGKTHILTKVIGRLKTKFKTEGPIADVGERDQMAIFCVESSRVKIFSGGDSKDKIEKYIKDDFEYDLYVGASHLYGDTVNCYFDKFGLNVYFINLGLPKYNEVNTINAKYSDCIIDLIYDHILRMCGVSI